MILAREYDKFGVGDYFDEPLRTRQVRVFFARHRQERQFEPSER